MVMTLIFHPRRTEDPDAFDESLLSEEEMQSMFASLCNAHLSTYSLPVSGECEFRVFEINEEGEDTIAKSYILPKPRFQEGPKKKQAKRSRGCGEERKNNILKILDNNILLPSAHVESRCKWHGKADIKRHCLVLQQ